MRLTIGGQVIREYIVIGGDAVTHDRTLEWHGRTKVDNQTKTGRAAEGNGRPRRKGNGTRGNAQPSALSGTIEYAKRDERDDGTTETQTSKRNADGRGNCA